MPSTVQPGCRRGRRLRAAALVVALLAMGGARGAAPGAAERVQLDPFARATTGDPGCPVQPPPLLAAEDARTQAHARVERGLRCAMDGTCAPGGSYRQDPALNEAVRMAIADDPHFADTSVWVTTSRHWVTLQGCVPTAARHRALVASVRALPGVERVFDELKVVPRHEPNGRGRAGAASASPAAPPASAPPKRL